VYRGRMVAMRATNTKLRRRGVTMVAQIAGCDAEAAASALTASEGDIPRAVLVALGIDREEAARLLARSGGNLRAALAEAGPA
jgi:N-acetylmuramic acid 6-phosphate etherase